MAWFGGGGGNWGGGFGDRVGNMMGGLGNRLGGLGDRLLAGDHQVNNPYTQGTGGAYGRGGGGGLQQAPGNMPMPFNPGAGRPLPWGNKTMPGGGRF